MTSSGVRDVNVSRTRACPRSTVTSFIPLHPHLISPHAAVATFIPRSDPILTHLGRCVKVRQPNRVNNR